MDQRDSEFYEGPASGGTYRHYRVHSTIVDSMPWPTKAKPSPRLNLRAGIAPTLAVSASVGGDCVTNNDPAVSAPHVCWQER